jgi:hypothetical protein
MGKSAQTVNRTDGVENENRQLLQDIDGIFQSRLSAMEERLKILFNEAVRSHDFDPKNRVDEKPDTGLYARTSATSIANSIDKSLSHLKFHDTCHDLGTHTVTARFVQSFNDEDKVVTGPCAHKKTKGEDYEDPSKVSALHTSSNRAEQDCSDLRDGAAACDEAFSLDILPPNSSFSRNMIRANYTERMTFQRHKTDLDDPDDLSPPKKRRCNLTKSARYLLGIKEPSPAKGRGRHRLGFCLAREGEVPDHGFATVFPFRRLGDPGGDPAHLLPHHGAAADVLLELGAALLRSAHPVLRHGHRHVLPGE